VAVQSEDAADGEEFLTYILRPSKCSTLNLSVYNDACSESKLDVRAPDGQIRKIDENFD